MSVVSLIVLAMEWIATCIATVAALVAGWQAWEARRARIDARSSASEAQGHEARAVAASERIAAAVEEQNENERAKRAERERYKNPWSMDSSRDNGTRAYKFILGGTETLTDVQLMIDDQHMANEKFHFVKPTTETMRPGESMTLSW